MSRLTAGLLLHVNFLLALYCGAALATAARLRWDPTTYVCARAVFPRETRLGRAALTAAPLLLLALAHLPLAALLVHSRRLARTLYILYAALMTAAGCLEAAWAAWTAAQVLAWLHSAQAEQLRQLIDALSKLEPLLRLLSDYNTLPAHVNSIIEEVESDAPANLYVLYVAGGALIVLQGAAVVLAVRCAMHVALPSDPPSYRSAPRPTDEKAPLKTVYREGKLMIL